MIRSDFYRILKRKRIWILAIFMIFFSVSAYIEASITDMSDSLKDLEWFVQPGAKTFWAPFFPSPAYTIYQYLVYFIVALPAADLFIEDRQSKLLPYFQMNVSKKRYVLSHVFCNFIASGLVGILPLLLISIIGFMVIPAVGTHPINIINVRAETMYFYDLFFDHFWIYFLIVQCRAFVGCGIIGSFAMAANNTMHNAYVGYILPLLTMGLSSVFPIIPVGYPIANIPSTIHRLYPGDMILILFILLFIGGDIVKQVRK